MASEYSPDGEVGSAERSVFDDGLSGVFRTGRREAAGGWGEGADAPLIEDDGHQEQLHEHFAQESGCSQQGLADVGIGHGVFSCIFCRRVAIERSIFWLGKSSVPSQMKAMRSVFP